MGSIAGIKNKSPNTYGQPRNVGGSILPNPSWLQPAWYVDPVTGNDTHDGTSPATAVKTVMGGVVKRWGTSSPILAQNTTIFVLQPETPGQEEIVLAPIVVQGFSFAVVCSYIGGATFSPVSVDVKMRGAPGNSLTLHGVPGAPSAGQNVLNVTKNSYARINAVAAGVAQMTQPFAASTLDTITGAPVITPDDSWVATDTYQLLEQMLLNLKVFSPAGGDNTHGETACCWVQNAFLPDTGLSPGRSAFVPTQDGPLVIFSNCEVDPQFIMTGAFITLGGWFPGGTMYANGASMYGGGSNSAGYVSAAFNNGGVADCDAILNVDCEVIGPNNLFGAVQLLGPMQVYNSSSVKISPLVIGLGQLWGSGGVALVGVNGPAAADACIINETGGPWVNCLTLTGGLTINGSGTGSKYAAGVWTDGIPITPLNLDTSNGLQNPRTGCRFAVI